MAKTTKKTPKSAALKAAESKARKAAKLGQEAQARADEYARRNRRLEEQRRDAQELAGLIADNRLTDSNRESLLDLLCEKLNP